MARHTGDAIFAANFEPQKGSPLDARSVVDNKSDLLLGTTWIKVGSNAYVYVGMIVSVVADSTPDNNGVYVLIDLDYTQSNNWVKIAGIRSAPNNRPNLLINSNFDFWQEATSLSSGTGGRRTSDGGFTASSGGTTHTPSRQAFTVGQTSVPNGPKYFKRAVVSSVAGASNYCAEQFDSESLEITSGKKITFSVWLKADTTKNIAVEFVQRFGTGGSASVDRIGIKKQQITAQWARYTFTADMPSINGKTIGTTPGNIRINIWFDAGSNFNSRTDSLGQQSGTFDIAQVKLEIGDYATDWEPYNLADELVKCQRYCEKSYDLDTAPGTATRNGEIIARMPSATDRPILPVYFKVVKAYTPTITYYSGATGAANNILLGGTTDSSVLTTPGASQTQTGIIIISGTTTDGAVASYQFLATAYL